MISIRSFDNTRSETIQFRTPLTLIVGSNGSGKTTIIECLKYATTGDLPPNSKSGGAFIHDPKLCGEKEVLAQVKLSFVGTGGAQLVATRNLQLTVKKATRQQKTLEGQLLMRKDGERTAISSRVAELDQLMPQYLGVSKAVLDSVIFCHQDESLWPMSEPSVLKKRFDEIFEALKYTKAIDNIKILRKKQNEELGKYKLLEQQYKIDKDRADRAEKQSRQLSNEIETLRTQCQELKHEIEKATRESSRLWEEAAVFEQIIGTLNGKRIEAQAKKESIDDLGQHIELLPESDEDLTSTLAEFEQKVAILEGLMESRRRQWQEKQDQVEDKRAQLGAKLTEVGKYEAEKAQHERQISRRGVMVKETARRHTLRGFDTDIDDNMIRDFMDRIVKMSRDQSLTLERSKRDTRAALSEAQNDLNVLGERRSALTQTKEHARQEIASNDKKANAFQTELDSIPMDEGGQATLESAVEEVQERLRKAKHDFEAGGWDHRLHEANEQLRAAEDAGDALNTELMQNTRKAGDLAHLQYLQKELKDRRRGLETMSAAHGERIRDVIGPEWQPATVEQDFQRILERKKSEVSDAERQRDGISRELEQVQFKLSIAKDATKQKRRALEECESRVRDTIDDEPDEYPDYVSQLESNRDIRKSDVDNFANLAKYYGECLKTAADNSVCRLCLRQFKSDKEQSRFVERLEKLMSQHGQQLIVDELKEFEEDLGKAREVGPSYDSYQRLSKTEIPELEQESERLTARRDQLLVEMEQRDKLVEEKDAARTDAEILTKTVQNVARYSGEIENFQTQLEELSIRQKSAGLGRSLEEIQTELENQREKSRAAKNTVNRLTADRERSRGAINGLELDLRDIGAKVTEASHHLDKKRALAARVEELKQMNVKQREATRKADEDIEGLAPALARAQSKYDDINDRAMRNEARLQQEATKLSDSVHQLRTANEEIESYVRRGGPAQASSCQEAITDIQGEIALLETEQKQVTKEINRAAEQLRDNDKTKRTISDNLRYRRDLRALESVNAEITELESEQAEIHREEFVKQADEVGRRHRQLSAEEATKFGAMKSKDNELARLIEDWNTDFKDAAQNFKEAHIKVETTKAAVEDLGRYGSALDKAIMKYHSLKMEEVNRIVEELWKSTYQGTDVDTVLIRSDNESTRGNRSYNYRVCMVKQDAEMDMRGRCSAGQKVLASILIRLALAECFGTSCGLIALDEPTTNLDRDNIRSLAESLHGIIRARRKQLNFQLIVITHDEDFLRSMKCADFCDDYYRVRRNNRQKSEIVFGTKDANRKPRRAADGGEDKAKKTNYFLARAQGMETGAHQGITVIGQTTEEVHLTTDEFTDLYHHD
ncbi:MAG: DNA repair protein rad50 [Caeruleum heppii]|nr:MAG: DNA repair protein rad50 [Caeruleum heppii]